MSRETERPSRRFFGLGDFVPAAIRYIKGDTGARGPQGEQGPKGDTGAAATVAVGSTTTLPPGSSASVTNSGTSGAAVLEFAIPAGATGATGAQGPQGQKGDTGAAGKDGADGAAATIAVGTVTTLEPGSDATVTNAGTSAAAVFNFGIPKGATGATGATGQTGAAGAAATIAVGTVTTLEPGSDATVTNAGTSAAAVFNFGIPKGAKGDTGATGQTGAAGAAATIAVGTVTTLDAGASATVTNAGTSAAAVFNFGIPKGAKGDTGAQGPQGPAGAPQTPYSSTPAMDGTGSAGSSDAYARGDHVHPSDTSKADVSDLNSLNATKADKTELRYAFVDLGSVGGSSGSVVCDDRAINSVSLGAGVTSLTIYPPSAVSGKARDFFLRATVADTTGPSTVTLTGATIDIGATEITGMTQGVNLLMFTEIASGHWMASRRSAS